MNESDSRWSYEPDRREALLHIIGWSLFVVLVVMAILGRGNATLFDLQNIPGFGWIISLGAMEVLARKRAGVSWGGWSTDAMRRTWQINSYTLRPWKIRDSLAVLRRDG